MTLPKASWLRRATQIAGIFAKYGFATAIHTLGQRHLLPKRMEEITSGAAQQELPVRLRLALEEIGPTAIKLGQILSSRADVLPIEYVRELRKLVDEVPPVPFEEAQNIIETELNGNLPDLFLNLDKEPVASASIGQVYYAVLLDGRQAAVKVQRPGILATVDVDLQILLWAAKQAEHYTKWGKLVKVSEVAEELAYTLRNELNYSIEGRNTDLLRSSLTHEAEALVPEVYWETSTSRVLALQRMEGVKASETGRLTELGIDRRAAAYTLAKLMLKQIFETGQFHADPHVGNILFTTDAKIVFLDCANTVYLGTEMRQHLVLLLQALLEGDAHETADQIVTIGAPSKETDLQKLYLDIQTMLSRYGKTRSVDIGLREILDHLMHTIFNNQIHMPSTFAPMVKTLVMLEGLCLQLDPEFHFPDTVRAIARDIVPDWSRPFHAFNRLSRAAQDFERYLSVLPRRLTQLLTKIETGNLTVKAVYEDIERPMRLLAMIIDRLAVSLLVASLILASALILSRGGLPALSGAGNFIVYGAALVGVFLGGWLLFSIIRSGRM